MKGVSQVITAVLLVSVSVALASLYAGWAPELSRNITSKAVDNAESATKCRNAALSVQNPYYDTNAQTAFFTLKNTGTITFAKGIEVIGLNVSKINSTEVFGLTPGQKKTGSFDANRAPEKLIVQPKECPGLRAEADDIEIRN